MNTFDFPYTCSIIDGEFGKIEDAIFDTFDEHMDEFFPHYYQLKNRDNIRNSFTDELFKKIKESLEKVRSTNIDMRQKAEESGSKNSMI